MLQEKHVTAECHPIFSNSFSQRPDMLLQGPTHHSHTVCQFMGQICYWKVPPKFLHNLLVYGPDMLLQSPTQITCITQFVHGPNKSLHSHPNSYITYLDAPAPSSMVDHKPFDIRKPGMPLCQILPELARDRHSHSVLEQYQPERSNHSRNAKSCV